MIKELVKALVCRHKLKVASACPFTGYTYTLCANCGKRLAAEKFSV